MSDHEPKPLPDNAAETAVRARRNRSWLAATVVMAAVLAGVEWGPDLLAAPAPAAPPPAAVAVSAPLQRVIDQRLSFMGQFAAVRQVEIRPQVGGTLTGVFFTDGAIVRRGQPLFEIDPVPYRIKVAEARAALESAQARLALATRELARAQALKAADAGSGENVDLKVADKAAAQAAVDGARATLNDARFDLDRTRVSAPFTGRIGTHLVSVGNLVAGSRAAASPTTLLTTLVSLDPVWLNFDMSEADYASFQHHRAASPGAPAPRVEVAVGDGAKFDHAGTLDFIDNAIDRGSGNIHARATLGNPDTQLTPGSFGRVRVAIGATAPVLLVPDAGVLSDQGDHAVFVVGKGNVAAQKKVAIGDLRGGLRVITSGLDRGDRVIIDGIPSVKPGARIRPEPGSIRFDPSED